MVMDRELIRKALYNKYIEPTKKLRENYIGIEIEIPIVNMNKEAVDFYIVHEMTKKFMNHFEFKAIGIDENGDVYSAQNNIEIIIIMFQYQVKDIVCFFII